MQAMHSPLMSLLYPIIVVNAFGVSVIAKQQNL